MIDSQRGGLVVGILFILLVAWLVLRRMDSPHELYIQGKLADGLDVLRGLVDPLANQGFVANTAICLLVAAGRYQEALTWVQRAIASGGRLEPLLVINGAEAAYNLGEWKEAEAMLDRLRGVQLNGMEETGWVLQRAWVAARLGRGDEALRLVDGCDADRLPYQYRNEWHYTRAVALWTLGRVEEAAAAALRGTAVAGRVSAHRNGSMLSGRIALAAGDLANAQLFLETAAQHPYLWQGGDGLLALAKTLKRLDRHEESNAMLARVLTQDPESESATEAAQLLGVPPPPAFSAFFGGAPRG